MTTFIKKKAKNERGRSLRSLNINIKTHICISSKLFQLEENQRAVIENDPNFILTLFLLVAFILSWLPLLALKIYEYLWPVPPDIDLSMVMSEAQLLYCNCAPHTFLT